MSGGQRKEWSKKMVVAGLVKSGRTMSGRTDVEEGAGR